VIWHEWLGKSVDEIADEYDLNLSDIYAALAFYYDPRDEINQSIRESEAFVEQLREQISSKIPSKINGRTSQVLHR